MFPKTKSCSGSEVLTQTRGRRCRIRRAAIASIMSSNKTHLPQAISQNRPINRKQRQLAVLYNRYRFVPGIMLESLVLLRAPVVRELEYGNKQRLDERYSRLTLGALVADSGIVGGFELRGEGGLRSHPGRTA